FPFFTQPFLEILSQWDITSWDIFEWGSGYSTIWFANHCRSIVSVDHDIGWISSIKKELAMLHLINVILKERRPDLSQEFYIGDGGEDSAYVKAIDEDDRLYDCIIIDGQFHRNACGNHVLSHIKKGGIIILDNANQATIGNDSAPIFDLLKDYEHHSFLQIG